MSIANKEKLEHYSDDSFQVITTTCIEDSIEEKTDNFIIELSLEKRRKEANKTLYINRI